MSIKRISASLMVLSLCVQLNARASTPVYSSDDAPKTNTFLNQTHETNLRSSNKSFEERYAEIGKNYQHAFFNFNDWEHKLPESLPDEFQGGDIVHNWYLVGRRFPETHLFKKFCYLFAAGRAGHYYAAIEAGEMLKLASTNDIPPIITLDMLEKEIGTFSSKAIRDWDVKALNHDIISDPELQCIYDLIASDNKFVDELVDQIKSAKNTKEVNRLLINFFNAINDRFREFEESLKQYKPLSPESEKELEILSLFKVLLERETLEHTYVLYLLDHLRELNKGVKSSSINKAIQFLFNKSKKLGNRLYNEKIQNLINKLRASEPAYLKTPLYWDLLSNFCAILGLTQEEYLATCKASKLQLNAEQLGSSANLFLHLLKAEGSINPSNAFTILNRIDGLYMYSCLLGDLENCDKMLISDRELYNASYEAMRCCSEHIEKFLGYSRQKLALAAFALQLTLLREPDNILAHDLLCKFYNINFQNNPERSLAFNKHTKKLKRAIKEKQEKEYNAEKDSSKAQIDLIHQHLSQTYFRRLLSQFKGLKKSWLRYKDELNDEIIPSFQQRIDGITQDIEVMTILLQEGRAGSAANFFSRCEATSEILKPLAQELHAAIHSRKIVKPAIQTLTSSEKMKDSSLNVTREVKEEATRKLLNPKSKNKNQDAVATDDKGKEEESEEPTTTAFQDITFDIECPDEWIELSMNDRIHHIIGTIRKAENRGDAFRRLMMLPGNLNFEKLKMLANDSIRISNKTYTNIETAWSLRLNNRIRFCILWCKDNTMPILVAGEYKH